MCSGQAFIAKIKKGSNSVNTDDRVMVLAFCNSLHSSHHCMKFHLFIFNTFRDMLRTSLLLQNLEREITLKLLVTELQFLHYALSLTSIYQCIKFHLIPFYTFRDMLQTSFLLQNEVF